MLMGNNVGVSAVNTYFHRHELLSRINEVAKLTKTPLLINGNFILAISNYVYNAFNIKRMLLLADPSDIKSATKTLYENYLRHSRSGNMNRIPFPKHELDYAVKVLISFIEDINDLILSGFNIIELVQFKNSMIKILNDISSICKI